MKNLLQKGVFVWFCCLLLVSSVALAQAQNNQLTTQNVRGPVNTQYPGLSFPKADGNTAIVIQKYTGSDETNPYHPTRLVSDLLASGCLSASNISFSGNRNQIGRFERNAINPSFPLESGIIISTGDVSSAVGPNVSPSTTSSYSARGDADLSGLSGYSNFNILDVAVLQFDFVPDGDIVEFRYVFASEEYAEYACSQYNDVFGFFISGPGLTGPYSNNSANIALLPDGSPVAINNIHVNGTNGPNGASCPDENAEYYVNVPPGALTIEYDGRTTVLTARIEGLTPCETYGIKIAIADVSDRQLDSAVFLEAQSFSSTGSLLNIRNLYDGNETYDVFQACEPNELRFYRVGSDTVDVTFDYEILGTAIAGTHYTGLASGTATIPEGSEYIAIPYSLPQVALDGTKTIVARVETSCPCDDESAYIEKVIRIHDPFIIQNLTVENEGSCFTKDGNFISILAGSGASNFDYVFTYELIDETEQVVSTLVPGGNTPAVFSNLPEGEYLVRVTDNASCHVIYTDPIQIASGESPDLMALSNSPICEGKPIELFAVSETAGLTYSWTGPNGFTSDLANPVIEEATLANGGTYEVTATAPNGCIATATVEVEVLLNPCVEIIVTDVTCYGDTDGSIRVIVDPSCGGVVDICIEYGELTQICDPKTKFIGQAYYPNLQPGTYYIVINGANGCSVIHEVEVGEPDPLVAEVDYDAIICEGELSTVVVSATGGTEPYEGTGTFELGPGTYEFNIVDAHGCEDMISITIEEVPLPVVTLAPFAEVCEDAEAFELTGGLPVGGTYFVDGVEASSFNPGVGAGIYDVTYEFEDENGCSATAEGQIVVHALPEVTLAEMEPVCIDAGMIMLSGGLPAGGTYYVDGGEAASFDPATGAGSYLITYVYTDENGCSNSAETQLIVNPLPIVEIGPYEDLCMDAEGFTFELIEGGIWYVNGVEALGFDPSMGAGTYTITLVVTDENGCSNSDEASLIVNPLPEVSLADFADVCVDAEAFVLNGGLPVGGIYAGTGVAEGMFDPAIAGVGTFEITYTFTDEHGCTNFAVYTITVNPLPEVTLAQFDPFCEDAEAIVLTGGMPVGGTYFVDGVEATSFDPAVGAGSYLVTYVYTDENGCTNDAETTIVVNPLPEVSLEPFADICEGEPAFELTGGMPVGGTYYVDGVVATTFDPAIVGSYEVVYEYTDQNGCTASATQTIEVTPVPCFDVEFTDVTCFGADDGTITVTVDLDCGPVVKICLEYGTIEIPSDNANKFLSGAEFTDLEPGTYLVVVTGENGCESVQEVTIGEPPLLIAHAEYDDAICEGSETLVVITAEGGTPPYEGLGEFLRAPGEYTFMVTDANGCEAEVVVTIEELPLPTVTLAAFDDVCIDVPEFELFGGMPEGGIYYVDGVETSTFDPAAGAGTYNVLYEYTDQNGCTNTAEATITVNPLPEVSLADFADVCVDAEAFVLNGGLPVGGIYAGTGVAEGMFDPAIAGVGTFEITYTFTDEHGCTNFAVYTITVNPLPEVTLAQFDPFCEDAEAIVLTGGMPVGGTYFVDGVEATSFDPAVGAGSYLVTYVYTDENGCTNDAETTIVVNPLPEVSLEPFVAICDDEAAFILEGGLPLGGTYAGPGVADGMFDPAVAGAGIHEIIYTYTDENGCTNFAVQPIEVLQSPCFTYEFTDVTCFGADNGTITVTVDLDCGPVVKICLEYGTIEIPSDNANKFLSGAEFTDLEPGTYLIVVTGANGCETVEEVTIGEPELLVAEWEGEILCYGDLVEVTVTAMGGTPPYRLYDGDTFVGDFVEGSIIVPNVPAGIFSWTVIDANDCVAEVAFELTEPEALVADWEGEILCNGDLVNITVTAEGGIAPYQLFNGETLVGTFVEGTIVVPNVGAGTYNWTVVDANDCSAVVAFELTEPAALVADWEGEILCHGDLVDIIVTAMGGTAPYELYDGETLVGAFVDGTFTVADVAAGSYNWNVVDANGCVVAVAFELTQPELLVADLDLEGEILCNGDVVDAIVTVTGGTLPISLYDGETLVGQFVDGVFTVEGIGAGSYNWTVVDANGCSDIVAFELTEPDVLEAALEIEGEILCNGDVVDAVVTATGGTAPYMLYDGETLVGQFVEGSYTVAGIGAGEYLWTVVDANGCQAIVEIELTEPELLVADWESETPCFGQVVDVTVTAEGGTLPYQLFDGETLVAEFDSIFIVPGIGAGEYFWTVVDANGCSVELEVEVDEYPLPEVTFAPIIIDGQLCTSSEPLALTGGMPIGGIYSGPGVVDGMFDPSLVVGGIHEITYTFTDENGCSNFATQTIEVTQGPCVEIISTDVTCNGANDGTIRVIIDPSCVEVIEICIVNSEDLIEECLCPDKINGAYYFNMAPGTYYIVALGANGCYTVHEVTINEPPVLEVAFDLVEAVVPVDGTTTVTITATGGTPPYTGTGEFTVGAGTHVFEVTDANGCVSSVNVTVETTAPAAFKPNYPNPFHTLSSVEFTLYKDNQVKIEVLNLTGQVQEILRDEFMQRGDYKVDWEPRDVKPGMYILRITYGNQIYSTKLIYQP